MARVCLTSSQPEGDITDAVQEHFGRLAGSLITLGYVLAIWPILMVYAISMTNTLQAVLSIHLGIAEMPRWLLSFLCIAAMVSIMVTGPRIVLKVTEVIVWPLIAVLLGISLYLIPQWHLASFGQAPTLKGFLLAIFLTLPVLVFAFDHLPAVSTFCHTYRQRYGSAAQALTSRVLRRTAMLLTLFIMFFVFSCVLALTPEELQSARDNNLPVLAVFSQKTGGSLFGWMADIFALASIATSFFGHYMGTHEGLQGIATQAIQRGDVKKPVKQRRLSRFCTLAIFLTLWAVAYADVGVMDLIEALVAPILAFILFIMPVIATRRVAALKPFRSALDYLILIMGIATILGFVVAKFVL